MGRIHVHTDLKFKDGDILICIIDRYANFTKGKEYPVFLKRGNEPCIEDDDHDDYYIGRGDVGRMFVIKGREHIVEPRPTHIKRRI